MLTDQSPEIRLSIDQSVLKIALQTLGHVLFSIDQDEGVPKVAFKSNPGTIDSNILSIDVVISILILI
jgi:hypothetical protein